MHIEIPSKRRYNHTITSLGGNKMNREARILKARRKELGLSQTDVALNAGIQIQQYQKFEYGQRKLSNSSMVLGLRICAILELDPYEFAFESDFDWMKKIR